MAADRIRAGGAHIIVAGGSESMSMIPMAGLKPAPNPWLVDHQPEIYINMGLTAERAPAQIRRFARGCRRVRLSQPPERAEGAGAGNFDEEIVPVTVETAVVNGDSKPHRTETIFDKDEGPRADTSSKRSRNSKPSSTRRAR